MVRLGRKRRARGFGALRNAASFVLGAVTGGLVSLLYAPASGRAMRRRIIREGRNLKRAALRQLGQTRRLLRAQATQAREAAVEWVAGHVPQRNNRPHPARRRVIRHATAH
jgi:hypothetical protein